MGDYALRWRGDGTWFHSVTPSEHHHRNPVWNWTDDKMERMLCRTFAEAASLRKAHGTPAKIAIVRVRA